MRARFDAKGDVIVVTGGANGIGRALARAAAQAGARVVVCDVDAAASRILPMAVALNAMSASTGNAPAEGSAMAMGLLPTMASAPPGGGINGRVFESTMPTQFCSAIMRA